MDNSKTKDEYMNLIKIYDLTENYGDMLYNISELSKAKYEVNNEELELFTRCFKSYVGGKRNQYRKVIGLIIRDTDNEEVPKKNSDLYYILKEKLSQEIIKLCYKIIEVCQNYEKMENLNKLKKLKLYFLKNIADHYRYIYEINESEETKEITKKSYEAALNSANNDKFPQTDITYLTFFLNYTVFLHDVMNDRSEAMDSAKKILHQALRETEEITENHQKDIILLCQMIKDNLSLWKNEIEESTNI